MEMGPVPPLAGEIAGTSWRAEAAAALRREPHLAAEQVRSSKYVSPTPPAVGIPAWMETTRLPECLSATEPAES